MPDQNNDHPEKLSERLEIRLHHSAKQRFLAACRRTGDVPSDVLRAAMKGYIETVEAAEQPSLAKELSMKLIHNPLKTLAALGTSVAAAVMFTATPSIAEDRDATPIAPPFLVYPAEMIEQGISGECTAIFDVSRKGTPENVKAQCTHHGFVEVIIEAASALKFQPKIKDGQPARRQGVEYPFVFQLDNDDITTKESFAESDKNKDGILTAEDNIAPAFIDKMDKDGDGGASFSEYEAYLSENAS